MKHSDSIANIAQALSLAQAAMGSAIKGKKNPHFQSTYADLASYIEASREPLAANGLALVQGVEADGAKVTITTMVLHKSGEWLQSSLTLTAGKPDPQGVGSAISYGRRYSLAAMLNMGAEDDDGNRASEPAPAPVKTPVAPRPSVTTPASRPSEAPAAPTRTGQERYNDVCEDLDRRLGIKAATVIIDRIKAKHGGSTGTKEQKLACLDELEALVRGDGVPVSDENGDDIAAMDGEGP